MSIHQGLIATLLYLPHSSHHLEEDGIVIFLELEGKYTLTECNFSHFFQIFLIVAKSGQRVLDLLALDCHVKQAVNNLDTHSAAGIHGPHDA